MWTSEQKDRARIACQKWVGTPHIHATRLPGIGVDCVHFVVDVLEEAGVIPKSDIPNYPRNIALRGAEEKLIAEFSSRVKVEVVREKYSFGDCLIFDASMGTNHVGILIDGIIWHSLVKGGVINHPFSEYRNSIRGAMRLV